MNVHIKDPVSAGQVTLANVKNDHVVNGVPVERGLPKQGEVVTFGHVPLERGRQISFDLSGCFAVVTEVSKGSDRWNSQYHNVKARLSDRSGKAIEGVPELRLSFALKAVDEKLAPDEQNHVIASGHDIWIVREENSLDIP